MTKGHLLAWHFTAEPNKLRDGSPLKINRWTKYTGPLKMCHAGLHASVDPFDALAYAPRHYLWRVECGGEIVHAAPSSDPPKLVCSQRKVLGGGDAEAMLRAYGRACASDVLHLWDAPQVVKDYLATGDEKIRDAAWDAAWDAARDAARDAAWDAARAAAWAAAWDAARAAQNKRFNAMVEEWYKTTKEGK